MLHLKFPTTESRKGETPRIALSVVAALRLERALLTNEFIDRRRLLSDGFKQDKELAGWALRTAECRLDRTINRIEEAADWLGGCLESELAAALELDSCIELPPENSDIEWRLPALVARLSAGVARVQGFNERLEREKLESLKELAYGASHEINNPLANIAARAQTLLADEPDPERQRKLAAIHRQAMRAHEMIADLMLFARPPKLQLEPCNLAEIVSAAVERYRDLAEEHEVQLSADVADSPIEAFADPTQIAVALQALVVNSLEAVGPGGQVRVRLRCTDEENLKLAEISVLDDGPGISEEVRAHMFDPFYSGREAGRGLGFGLSKCWRIVTDHGGNVAVRGPAVGGAEIAILLPLTAHSERGS